ncbi:hypothetical protein K490DRAFT_71425 [Saccharata proteae CBS 121410]|uniref:protein-histidine N-methyltransferase n=1 Tax=Saccharata proteae CBS 121410 TaxID=1314787 RepID=A0A9P4LZB3_9PEZI|nr:hypothetical protein K490DRAFT_71425 [Saccharata proteae CBS 121410]
MAQPFSFGFAGDDIDVDVDDAPQTQTQPGPTAASHEAAAAEPAMIEARSHTLDELLSTLPSKISYSTVEIESPSGKKLHVPRRELFDVRLQLMAEEDDDAATSSTEALAGLDNSDIRTNIYEGGFKSWECSLDLAKLLLDRGPRKDIDDMSRVDHVLELGCGTAIPTLILFHHALTTALPLYITLADYNASVLRLVTLPNLLLTFAGTLPASSPVYTSESPNPIHPTTSPSTGDLDITPALLSAFKATLASHQLHLTFVSGAWTPAPRFASLVPSSHHLRTLVLASETIYSPAALTSFADVLVEVLKRVREGKAMVAAKRVYFGVGGGVDAFKEACAERGAVGYEIENAGVEGMEAGGVRRWLGEVQMM